MSFIKERVHQRALPRISPRSRKTFFFIRQALAAGVQASARSPSERVERMNDGDVHRHTEPGKQQTTHRTHVVSAVWQNVFLDAILLPRSNAAHLRERLQFHHSLFLASVKIKVGSRPFSMYHY